jgi:5'-deoxynucleotidase YfbR-like HD superfamily hydrolase
LTQLWAEYTERSTPEGRFAVQIDKIEALLQAVEYQRAGHAADVNSFLRTAREEVSDPLLVELVARVEGLIHGGSTE